MFDLIIANREDLALILTFGAGKPLAEALGGSRIGGAYVEIFWPKRRAASMAKPFRPSVRMRGCSRSSSRSASAARYAVEFPLLDDHPKVSRRWLRLHGGCSSPPMKPH